MTCRINKEKEIVVDEKAGKLAFSNSGSFTLFSHISG